ncbi:MAG TPA: hypothetical protein VMF29_07705, partial [Candidatus Edwardsbacteria bacterium]|nr:hypothetical protein [Candidatus Edwardsbacteria bacterium]
APTGVLRKTILVSIVIVTAFAPACSKPHQHSVLTRDSDHLWSCSVDHYDSLEQFVLSPDGFTVSFLAKLDRKWYFCHSEGLRLIAHENATVHFGARDTGRTLSLSPDSNHVGIVYRHTSHWRDRGPHPEDNSGGQWFVEVDRHIFGGFDSDFKPTVHFARDGRLFGFPYKKLGQYYVQIADTTFGPYDRADVAFTRDGEIMLGYLNKDRAFIDMVKPQDDPTRVNPGL